MKQISVVLCKIETFTVSQLLQLERWQ